MRKPMGNFAENLNLDKVLPLVPVDYKFFCFVLFFTNMLMHQYQLQSKKTEGVKIFLSRIKID